MINWRCAGGGATLPDRSWCPGTSLPGISGSGQTGLRLTTVGTGELLASLKASEELGHRWVRIVEVGLLEPDQVARAYRNFLPGFEAYAEQLGDAAWQEFVRIRVCMGAAMPIRHVENHVRAYVRRMLVDCPNIASVDEISFDEEMFFMTLDEMPRQPDS